MTQIDDNEDETVGHELYMALTDEHLTILCPRHTKSYVEIMESMNKSYSLIQMKPEDADKHYCFACNMSEELSRPRIVTLH